MFQPLGIILDLDGTVYRGEQAIPGARQVIEYLRAQAHPLVFLTNAIEGVAEHVEKLAQLGVCVHPDEIITAANVLIEHLRATTPNARVFALADPVLIEQLAPHVHFTENPDEIDIVIASTDRALDYRKITIGFHALRRGARFWATNADATWAQDGIEIPDAGAVIGALEGCANRKVELVAGKPSPLARDLALARLGRSASECIIIGDSLPSDIMFGKNAGMKTALVLTGVTRREQLANASVQPDFVLEGIRDVPNLLRQLQVD